MGRGCVAHAATLSQEMPVLKNGVQADLTLDNSGCWVWMGVSSGLETRDLL